jgi:GDP-L-fucose synthase
MLTKNSKIYVAGHRGLVGGAILRTLNALGYKNIITRTHAELELMDTVQVNSFFEAEEPEYVFLAAARVGGILANNTYRAQFIYENLQIQNNVIHASYRYGVKKLLFLGSSCIYPKESPQPIKEEFLLTSPLEYTNEPYAIAKIAGLKCVNRIIYSTAQILYGDANKSYGPVIITI